jgi:hypothetical protein
MNNFPVPIWFLVSIFIVIVAYFIIDHYQYKRAMREAVDSINKIFDSIKTFLLITMIERISSAFEDSSEDEDEDDVDHGGQDLI